MFSETESPKANATETLLRTVMAAFWFSGWYFVGSSSVGDFWSVVLFILYTTFGVLLVRALRDSADSARINKTIRIQVAIIIFGLIIDPDSFNTLSPIVGMLAAMRLPRRRWIQWALTLGALTLVIDLTQSGYPLGFFDGLVGATLIGACSTFSYSLTRTQAARLETQALLADLREAHERLQKYAEQAEDHAIAEERSRISRDLHDTLGHRLTASIVQLEGAGRLVPDQQERAIQIIETVREQLAEGLDEVRETVSMLRTPAGTGISLSAALTQLAADFEQATHLPIAVSVPDDLPPLPEAARLALFRATQEALTNVQRHAEATAASVLLTLGPGLASVNVRVKDNGRGMAEDAISNGFGLRGMQERIAQLGGTVDIESTRTTGTSVSVTLPIGDSRDPA